MHSKLKQVEFTLDSSRVQEPLPNKDNTSLVDLFEFDHKFHDLCRNNATTRLDLSVTQDQEVMSPMCRLRVYNKWKKIY